MNLESHIEVLRYGHLTVERRHGGFVVKDCGHVLNTLGNWEYDPLPSSRTAEFNDRTIMTLARAVEIAEDTSNNLLRVKDAI